MSNTPGTRAPGPGGERDVAPARLTPTPSDGPGATGDDALRGFLGGNLVGSAGSGLDEAHYVEPGDGSLLDRDVQIGSALAGVHARHPDMQDEVPNAGSEAGAGALATGGGERAAAGRAPDTRSSQHHDGYE